MIDNAGKISVTSHYATRPALCMKVDGQTLDNLHKLININLLYLTPRDALQQPIR